MFVVSDTSSSDEENKKCLRMQRKTIRQKSDIFNLPDNKFEDYFCLNKTAFKYVLDLIEPKMKKGVRSTFVSNATKLAATLRFLAQGSYQLSVGNDFQIGLGQSTVCEILTETLNVLEAVLCPQWIKFDVTEEEKTEAKLYFFEKTGFPGVIGCVDGTHIKILGPEKENQNIYFNRKGYFSLNAMIICDHKMRIRFLDARHGGSSHDSLIWNISLAKRILCELYAAGERNSWLLGDAGYPLEPYLMTPYRSAEDRSAEAIFNTKHSKARNIVERTIGVLKSRFRCLLGARQLHYRPAKATKIANVCAAFHNICIAYGANITSDEIISLEPSQESFESNADIQNSPNIEASEIREQIKASFLQN